MKRVGRSNFVRVLSLSIAVLMTVLAMGQFAYVDAASHDATAKRTEVLENTNYTGLYQDTDGQYCYYKNGVFQKNYTGLYEHSKNGRFYYLDKGVWQSGYNGLYKHSVNGKYYYLNKGVWQNNYTGLYGHPINGNYYYLKKGIWQNTYAGLYVHSTNGKIYYLKSGIWQSKYTGFYVHSTNGKTYYIKNGLWQKQTAIYKDTNGTYYYIQNGLMDHPTGNISKLGSDTGVLVSIADQHLWYYKNGALVLSTPIVSGMKGVSDTPKGTFNIHNKVRNTRLVGPTWNVFVYYWMAIDSYGLYGIHDATWRNANGFGGNVYTYDGSHGCVNVPLDAMGVLFANIETWTVVKIY